MEDVSATAAASSNDKHPTTLSSQPPLSDPPVPFRRIIAVASIAAGLQFGWALQFSLLTPYIQLLGIPHKWASYIWLCGPISGLIVQPLAGHYSDNCSSRFGRRRPFIASAAFLVTLSVLLIGFAADLGRQAGDSLGSGVIKPRAIAIFVVGFWVLDVGNNLLMAPCRALLGDLSDGEQRKARNANAAFSFFMAVGSVAGYAAGSYSRLYKFLPFTMTEACDTYCANLKTCFLISATLLIGFTVLALFTVPDKPISRDNKEGEEKSNFFSQLLGAMKLFPRSMWVLLVVVSLTSLGLFAFILYDTDWMGKEVYGGKVGDGKLYDTGVRTGSLGLMLNSAVGGVTALGIMFLIRGGKTANRSWGVSNIMLGVCLAATVLITKEAQSYRHRQSLTAAATAPPSTEVKASALALFAVLGLPQTVAFTIPFGLASIFSSSCGAGQGLTMGVLNIAVVIPQLIVSLTSGPWDELFGGGNLPSFVVGAISAVIAGILALTLLPTPKSSETSTIEI